MPLCQQLQLQYAKAGAARASVTRTLVARNPITLPCHARSPMSSRCPKTTLGAISGAANPMERQTESAGPRSLQSAARTLPALRELQQELDLTAKPCPKLFRARNEHCVRYQAQSFAALQVQNSSRRRRAQFASRTRSCSAAHEPRRGRIAQRDGAAQDHDDALRRRQSNKCVERPQKST